MSYVKYSSNRLASMSFKALRAAALVAAVLCRVAQAAPQGQHVDFAGLYVRIDTSHVNQYPRFANALSKDFVDGAALVVQWSAMEPTRGAYEFAPIDHWIDMLVSQHKKISIGVMAGSFTPAWLYSAPYNVPKNDFRYNRDPQGEPQCTVLTLPSPWNDTFLSEYDRMIDDLARHLRDMEVPGAPRGAAFEALRIVKLDGINNTSEELRLVANKGDGGPCNQSDAQQIWAQAGFTPGKILKAWTTLTDHFAAVFPGRILSVDVIQAGAFPPIDESGHIYAPPPRTVDALTTRILTDGLSRFRGRFAVQWNALSRRPPNPAVIEAGANGAIVAWQMNEFLGPQGGTGCFYGEQRQPCKSTEEFEATMQNGIDLGGRFIEFWAPNVDDFEPAFRHAHEKLRRAE